VVFMDQGRIVEQGPPEDVLTNPRNERSRAFLSAVLH
jgi:polar amino acid transport system ATP-binding protein